MTLGLSCNDGDAKKLTVDLGRDLTGVSEARFVVAEHADSTPVVNEVAVIDDAAAGLVSYTLVPANDFGPGKLVAGTVYRVWVPTLPGPLTHPDDGNSVTLHVRDVPS